MVKCKPRSLHYYIFYILGNFRTSLFHFLKHLSNTVETMYKTVQNVLSVKNVQK